MALRVVAGLLLFAALAAPYSIAAQGATDVYLLPVHVMPGMIHAGAPVNISANAGYDNQPSFARDGASVFFTSVRAGGQSDIYRYIIASRQLQRVTNTPESEYSPLLTPDGNHISVIRVEADSAQRLWRFPLAGGAPSLVLENVRPVGYHAWLGDTTLALFVLGSPNTLQLGSSRSGVARVAANSIGRALHAIPGEAKFSFVDKSEAQWYVTSIDPVTGAKVRLVATSGRSEDIAWLNAGTILTSNGTQLLTSTRKADGSYGAWTVAVDLVPLGIRNVTRLAVSPAGDMIAIVAAEPAG